jgi:hypothetical protein
MEDALEFWGAQKFFNGGPYNGTKNPVLKLAQKIISSPAASL